MLGMMGLMGLSQLINGALGRAGSEEAQKLQMEFQSALQARQWEETARLQREIQALNARASRENARLAYERQRLQYEDQAFLNTWPLAEDPLTLRRDFQKMLDEGRRIPLQVIVPVDASSLNISGRVSLAAEVSQALAGAAQFMGVHYPHIPGAETPVKVYTNCSRSNTPFGTSQLHILYGVFHVAPTLVLLPYCTRETEFVIDCSYWDGRDTSKDFTPTLQHHIFSCNVAELQMQGLRDAAMEWKKSKQRYSLPDDENRDKLLRVVEKEKERREDLLHRGMPETDVRKELRYEFEKQYLEVCKSFPINLDRQIGEMVRSSCKVAMALMTDMHYLVRENKAPRFPQACRDELDKFPELLQTAESLFQNALRLSDGADVSAEAALGHARLACSYALSSHFDLAHRHYQDSILQMRRIVPKPEGGEWLVVPELPETVKTLESSSIPADDYLRSCLQELRRSPESLDARAAEAYHAGEWQRACDFWLRAAQAGDLKSCYNLAQMYEQGRGVPADARQAAYYIEKALSGGYVTAWRKAGIVILHYLREGEWTRALGFCVQALEAVQSPESVRQGAWCVSSELMLTSIASEIESDIRCRWLALARGAAGTASPNIDSLAIHMLQMMGDRNIAPALDALVLLLGKRCAETARLFAEIPFFRGIPDADGVKLQWPVQAAPEFMELLSMYLQRRVELQTPRCGEWPTDV